MKQQGTTQSYRQFHTRFRRHVSKMLSDTESNSYNKFEFKRLAKLVRCFIMKEEDQDQIERVRQCFITAISACDEDLNKCILLQATVDLLNELDPNNQRFYRFTRSFLSHGFFYSRMIDIMNGIDCYAQFDFQIVRLMDLLEKRCPSQIEREEVQPSTEPVIGDMPVHYAPQSEPPINDETASNGVDMNKKVQHAMPSNYFSVLSL